MNKDLTVGKPSQVLKAKQMRGSLDLHHLIIRR